MLDTKSIAIQGGDVVEVTWVIKCCKCYCGPFEFKFRGYSFRFEFERSCISSSGVIRLCLTRQSNEVVLKISTDTEDPLIAKITINKKIAIEAKIDKEHPLTFKIKDTKLDISVETLTEIALHTALHAALHSITEFAHIN